MLWKTRKTVRLRLPSPVPHKKAILEISMSNTSEWGATGGAGKTPQGTGRIERGLSGTSMTDLSGQVSGAIRESAREVKEQASNVAENAKGLASQAGEKLLSSVEEQKAAGADFVSGVAGAVRRAANEFDMTCLRLPSISASPPIRSAPYRMLSDGEISTGWSRMFRGLPAGSPPPFLAPPCLLDLPLSDF